MEELLDQQKIATEEKVEAESRKYTSALVSLKVVFSDSDDASDYWFSGVICHAWVTASPRSTEEEVLHITRTDRTNGEED